MGEDLKLFEGQKIRHVYDEEKETYYFSVVDIIAILIEKDYQTARKYWKVLKGRLANEGFDELVTNCYQLKLQAEDGKMRKTDCTTTCSLININSKFEKVPQVGTEPM